MIAVQRDAIVADAERDAVNLIALETQAMMGYLSTISTEAALLGGFAFNLYGWNTGARDDEEVWEHVIGVYYVLVSLSVSLLMTVVVYSSVVTSRAATMGLTGAKPSVMRQTVVLMREDQRRVERLFYTGIVAMIVALGLELVNRDIHPGWRVVSMLVLVFVGCVGLLAASYHAHKRYRTFIASRAIVSGDEFVKMKKRDEVHAAAEAAVIAAEEDEGDADMEVEKHRKKSLAALSQEMRLTEKNLPGVKTGSP